jgi:tetratricopeptide (TPR) repeat protein
MNWRTASRCALQLAGLLVGLTVPFVPALAVCDPNKAVLDQVVQLGKQGKFDDALKLLDGVPAAAQQDFRFTYVKGKMLYLSVAAKDPNHWNPPHPLSPTMSQGLQTLVTAAGMLPGLDAACVTQLNAYSVLNTIGAFYLDRGYFKDAENYLKQAYANDSRLSADTKRKVRDNLGLVYLEERRPDEAIRYYSEALTLKSNEAATQLVKAQALKTTPAAMPATSAQTPPATPPARR